MAKIPFSIDYRPQIESGEYKVVTGDDRPVRIISWDKKIFGGRFEIVGLVPATQGDTETVQLYCPDGTLIASGWNEKFKLFIITPEPELTEFEKTVGEAIYMSCDMLKNNTVKQNVREVAAKLLDLARKELQSEYDGKAMLHVSEKSYEMGKRDGKAEALKDLPRWKKIGVDTGQTQLIKGYTREEDELYRNGKCISLVSLEKLPGFKED